jgi:RecB family exonuclease
LITPRVTRLIRASDLRIFQEAVVDSIPQGWAARSTAIVVPGRSAAEELRRTIEDRRLSPDWGEDRRLSPDWGEDRRLSPDWGEDRRLSSDSGGALVLPDLVSRGELYGELHVHLPDAPAMLSEFEREVLLRLAADDARDGGAKPPFQLRPGLVAAILSFYDELRRRGRTVDSLDRIVGEKLAAGRESDRGAERLFRQTQFLAATFAAFERRVADSGKIDEHALRALLLSSAPPGRYRHIVVTVADQAAGGRGLWPADFDLLARLPGLERLDVIATERLLATGWHERLHDALPGIEETRLAGVSSPPVLMAPPIDAAAEPTAVFVLRDREEELADAARWIKRRSRDAGSGEKPRLERTGIVFQRPLPYLYLAGQVLGSANIPYQASDALPLAAEPFAAALDLVFAVAAEDASRAALIALLASPHWTQPAAEPTDDTPSRAAIAALDRLLQEVRFLGGWEQLERLSASLGANVPVDFVSAEVPTGGPADPPTRRPADLPTRRPAGSRTTRLWRRAESAMRSALALQPVFERITGSGNASAQIAAVLEFIAKFERPPLQEFAADERHMRARAAIVGALASLRDAHAIHDDRPLPVAELWATVRRWIEGQTFAPRTGSHGVRLLDAAAAPYAQLDAMRLVGLAESDWPERSTPSIFYPAALLRELGWPADADRLAAERARFDDLLQLPARDISASAFTLEDDALVPPSPFVDNVARAGLEVHRPETPPFVRTFEHEALSLGPLRLDVIPAVSTASAEWLARRVSRTPGTHAGYHGEVGPREPGVYAVSHVERYLECPFKYFAAQVLRLEEEREDESGLTPLERGQLLHGVFEAFYRAWHARGRSGVCTDDLDEALELFEEVAEEQLLALPEGDRALERTYLLGSAASPGLAERAFAVEIEQGIGVVERLLEYEFEGPFDFDDVFGTGEQRRVAVRGKVDRIDVLADGTLRVIDYKLGRAPKPARALQLPVYGLCAQQDLEKRRGRRWPLASAGYVAFKEKNAFVELGGRAGNVDAALREGQARFLDAVARIEGGAYPPDPDEPWTCTRCGFPHVCRKDYVGDE